MTSRWWGWSTRWTWIYKYHRIHTLTVHHPFAIFYHINQAGCACLLCDQYWQWWMQMATSNAHNYRVRMVHISPYACLETICQCRHNGISHNLYPKLTFVYPKLTRVPKSVHNGTKCTQNCPFLRIITVYGILVIIVVLIPSTCCITVWCCVYVSVR